MTKVRGFEVIKAYEGKGAKLPVRSSKNSAGYDFFLAEDVTIPSVWHKLFKSISTKGFNPMSLLLGKGPKITDEDVNAMDSALKPVLVPTGIKAYMGEDEYLQLANRSSNPLKRKLALSNGVGVIDSDYYNNEGNEGHIMFQFTNFGLRDLTLNKGEAIGQGVFIPFLKADDDNADQERKGGFGSTGN